MFVKEPLRVDDVAFKRDPTLHYTLHNMHNRKMGAKNIYFNTPYITSKKEL